MVFPRRQGRVGHDPERVKASVDCKGKVKHVPDGGGVNFGQYTEGGTASVAREGDTTKPGWVNFDPGGKYTIKWKPTGVQVS